MEQNKKRPRVEERLDQEREEEKENIILALVEEDEEEEEEMLPGFRFHPTDEELVTFYLRRKVAMKRLSIEIIREIDIYKFDPWDLPKTTTAGGEKEWYFFCLRGRKYRNSIRPNRVTGSGFWKATGIDRPIYPSSSTGTERECVGLKKSLVYYQGSAGKGTKTEWMMHEFRLPPDSKKIDDNAPPSMQEAEVWTICRIFKRNITYKKDSREATSKKISTEQYSSSNASSFESDGGDEYNYYNLDPNNYANYSQYQAEQLLANYNYIQERNRMYLASQWMKPTVQNQEIQYQSNVQNPIMINELYQQDGSLDELGQVMEFMNQNVTYDNYM
ncbi:hypothetical protein LUZ60_010373 [Juncus effusus]|nr:hypothetical protein LUZ60_010373 [Juncus effusus]